MNKILRFSFVALMAMVGMNVSAADITDELTWDKLLESGKSNSYQDFSGKTITSNAVYAGNASSGGDNYIQLRTNNNNAGIVTTTSGGKLKSVTIAFNSKTTDRSIDIYGSNSAYSAATDLYGDNAGTKLGTIAANAESMTLTVEGDYTFVGLRSTNGAIYVDQISIVWEGDATPSTKENTTISFSGDYDLRITCGKDETATMPTVAVMAGEVAVANAEVKWSISKKSGNEDLDGAAIENGKISVPNHAYGELMVKASYEGNDNYQASSASYTLGVYKGAMSFSSIIEDYEKSLNDERKTAELKAGIMTSYWQVTEDLKSYTAVVTYANGKYTYVNDGQNNMLFYGEDLGLKQGDEITGDKGNDQGFDAIWGKVKVYNGLLEFETKKDDFGFIVVSSGKTVSPKTITADNIDKNMNTYVKIENAQFVSVDNKNLVFKVGELNFAVYNQFGIDIEALEIGKTYTVTGMGSVYNTTKQLNLTEFKTTAEASVNTISTAKKNGAIYNLAGQRVQTMGRGLYIINGKKVIMK